MKKADRLQMSEHKAERVTKVDDGPIRDARRPLEQVNFSVLSNGKDGAKYLQIR